MTATLYLWVLPGRPIPPGYVPTDVVSRWPDDGSVRSRLYVCEVTE